MQFRPQCAPLRRSHRGMTLVEVLAVVVILGLLAGTLVVGFSASFGKAKHELAKSGIAVIVGKLEVYRMEHGDWPSNEQGLAALTNDAAKPTDPYFLNADQLIDPWGNRYMLVTPGPDGHPFEVVTYGADGQIGGEGESRDLSSVSLRGDQH